MNAESRLRTRSGRGDIVRLLLVSFMLVGSPEHSADVPKTFDPGQPMSNGLGMRFVPVKDAKVLFSVFETRVADFRVFVEETGYVHMRETKEEDSKMWSLDRDGTKRRGHSWENPGFQQTGDHPVVGISWYDAQDFCEWLTLRERAAGRLPKDWEYRLPKDHEWSVAVGLKENPAQTPKEKDSQSKEYPWGKEWAEGKPPPAGAGNYAGEDADDGHWPADLPILKGYRDGFARTAPVGSFKPNDYGIHDLGGNVWEWCQEEYRRGRRVLRGCAWRFDDLRDFRSSRRADASPTGRNGRNGFRCVIGPIGQ